MADNLTESEMEAVRALRQLGDAKAEYAIDQCRIMAHFWGDSGALRRVASALEASEQKLRKWAGAGAVMAAGFEDESKSIEWHYQLSLWRQGQWGRLYEWDNLANLGPAELKNLRLVDDKLRVVGKCLAIEDVVYD